MTAIERRIVTDGTRFRIQFRPHGGDWGMHLLDHDSLESARAMIKQMNTDDAERRATEKWKVVE